MDEYLKWILSFVSVNNLENEKIISKWRNEYDLEDELWINENYIIISLKQKESYDLWFELKSLEKMYEKREEKELLKSVIDFKYALYTKLNNEKTEKMLKMKYLK